VKKFSFRLASVLKLKEFNESKKKQELGQINKQCQQLRSEIIKCQHNIERIKNEENEVLTSNSLSADFLSSLYSSSTRKNKTTRART
jgi:flagellar biosynthesis chaperone FliJ